MRRPLVLAAAAVLAAPSAAEASGGGLMPAWGGQGATAPGHPNAYIALPAARGSIIQAVTRDGGAVSRFRALPRAYGVPSVAYDGSTTGLSADGRTLVLAAPPGGTYPPRRTRILVLDAGTLKIRTRLSLPGYHTVDAVSPDGRYVYVIRYTAPIRDITRYEVLAHDLEKPGAPEPVVDPEEPDERMAGMPLTRATSADGRWEYTLYSAREPFVHALDTAGRTAKCIDLPQLAAEDVSRLRLRLEGALLRVVRAGARSRSEQRDGEPVLNIDTRTLAVARPRAAAPVQDGGDTLWLPAAGGVAAAGAAALLARRRARAR